VPPSTRTSAFRVRDEEVLKYHGKIVSVAIKQILEKRIEYKLEE